jgi:hypothetical protein
MNNARAIQSPKGSFTVTTKDASEMNRAACVTFVALALAAVFFAFARIYLGSDDGRLVQVVAAFGVAGGCGLCTVFMVAITLIFDRARRCGDN